MAGGKGLDGWRCDLGEGCINELNGPGLIHHNTMLVSRSFLFEILDSSLFQIEPESSTL